MNLTLHLNFSYLLTDITFSVSITLFRSRSV